MGVVRGVCEAFGPVLCCAYGLCLFFFYGVFSYGVVEELRAWRVD